MKLNKKSQGDVIQLFFSTIVLLVIVFVFYFLFQNNPRIVKINEPVDSSPAFLYPLLYYRFSININGYPTNRLSLLDYGRYLVSFSKTTLKNNISKKKGVLYEVYKGIVNEINAITYEVGTSNPYFCIKFSYHESSILIPKTCDTSAYFHKVIKVPQSSYSLSDDLSVTIFYFTTMRYKPEIYEFFKKINSEND